MLEIRQISLVLAYGAAFGMLFACSGSDNPVASGAAGGAAAGTASVSGGSGAGVAGTASGGGGVSGVSGAGSSGGGGATAGQGNGTGGSATSGGSAGSSAGTAGSGGSSTPSTEKFSFFVTSVKAMVKLSGNEAGFGGDLSFGETGEGRGLRGADKICKTIAETASRKATGSFPARRRGGRQRRNAIDPAVGAVVRPVERRRDDKANSLKSVDGRRLRHHQHLPINGCQSRPDVTGD